MSATKTKPCPKCGTNFSFTADPRGPRFYPRKCPECKGETPELETPAPKSVGRKPAPAPEPETEETETEASGDEFLVQLQGEIDARHVEIAVRRTLIDAYKAYQEHAAA